MLQIGWLVAAMAAQTGPAIEPIYAMPAAFNASPGERMRLGALVPPALDVQDLVAAGITFFSGRTNEWSAPNGANGERDIAGLIEQRKAFAEAGAGFALSIFTTFPDFDDSLVVGEGMVNLIDGQRIPTFSPWDIERIRFSATGYGIVNRRLPKLDFVTLKVLNEFGDASFFTGLSARSPEQVAIWESVLRSAPPKAGFWAGDPKALASWTRRVQNLHGSIEQAYVDWGMNPEDPTKLPLPITPEYPYSARLEWMNWYREAIPSLVSQLCNVADEIFLETPLLIPIGPPNDLPYLGLDIYGVAKAAQKADGLKITNVGFYDFAEDWAMSLGRIRGAAKAASTPIWTEAPTIGTPAKFNQRLFTALSLGSRGHIDWPQAYRSSKDAFSTLMPHLTYSEPITDVAIIYPSSSHVLRPTQTVPALLYRSAVELRDYLDFDILDESAVIAGALSKYRVAVLLEGSIWDLRALNVMREWVRGGGVIAAYDFGRMTDPSGGISVWTELFGWSTQLPRARPDERWQGTIPTAYRVTLGGEGDEEFVQGRWGAGGSAGRYAFNGALLRLPARTGRELLVTVVFSGEGARQGQIDILVSGRKQAGITLDGGISRFQFVVSPDDAATGTIRIGFDGMGQDASTRIAAIEVAESGATSEPVELKGFYEAPVDPATIATQWSRPFGRGLAVFMPGQRALWKTYIAVVRALTYRLAEIVPNAAEAPAIDDRRDGVYVTNLGERIALFNGNASPVVKLVATREGRREVRLAANQTTILSLAPQPATIVVDCSNAPGATKSADGKSALVSDSSGLTVAARIPSAGTYRVFARTTRDGRPAPVRFTIGTQDFAPVSASATGDLYLVGSIRLDPGETRIVIGADRPFEAAVIVLTQDPLVAGYRLPQ
jgi:hypothetical protein